MSTRTFQYGRLLEDFEVGATYEHPWEVTLDAGTVGFFQASFQDAVPTFASARYARELGLRDRPMHSLLLLNFALSFSVHEYPLPSRNVVDFTCTRAIRPHS